VKTGQGDVLDADAGPGSVFHPTISANNDVPSATNLFWTNHDDLVFPWEKSGWLHLYAVPVQGGTARALTVGSSRSYTSSSARTASAWLFVHSG